MNNKNQDRIVSFIWGIADDVLRDVFVRGKYRDIILPFTVLRRIDALLVPTKDKVLENLDFMKENQIDNLSALSSTTGYPFYNTSKFTFERLLNDADNIDSNLENYLDGFSDNIQGIISKFKLRNQLETLKDSGLTYLLIQKFASKDINVSPIEAKDGKDEILPPLTNLGMGYVFEELIRKFNEDNNEEAGEHFTPRDIIQLMAHIVFEPVKDKIKKGSYLIYDPASGSGGMLTEAENYAKKITGAGNIFNLYGQEVNPETHAICTSDMLIKDENPDNIAFGSTLSKDGHSTLKFDFMLSNPPYGKTWKLDEDAIVDDRGKKGKQNIKDPRFQIGLPAIDDGQLLFLMNMVSKMKNNSALGSRIATVHNGSALFTGKAGTGESNIRKHIIENDLLECVIALPKNMFYNTGIPTYILLLNNRKSIERKGKVQLINALDVYTKLRKNLGDKNCEFSSTQIDNLTNTYLDFKETEVSKIYDNEFFGHNRITVERPLRLSAQFTDDNIENLRFDNAIAEEMQSVYSKFGDNIYTKLNDFKDDIQAYLDKNDIKLSTANKKKLFNQNKWEEKLTLYNSAKLLKKEIGTDIYNDFNIFKEIVDKAKTKLKLKLDATAKKAILNAVSWKNEDAEKVVALKKKDDTIISYEPDSDLRDTENVPLSDDIQEFFKREVLAHIPDAWIDHNKTVVGYEISFTRYFYSYKAPRSLDVITKEIKALESKTEGILNQIVNN